MFFFCTSQQNKQELISHLQNYKRIYRYSWELNRILRPIIFSKSFEILSRLTEQNNDIYKEQKHFISSTRTAV